MIRNEYRREARECDSCGRMIALNRYGGYRRHFTVEPDGRRHLCAAWGREPAGVVRLLKVEPTPEERHSHTLGLLKD